MVTDIKYLNYRCLFS